jgi:hypothetical protein
MVVVCFLLALFAFAVHYPCICEACCYACVPIVTVFLLLFSFRLCCFVDLIVVELVLPFAILVCERLAFLVCALCYACC